MPTRWDDNTQRLPASCTWQVEVATFVRHPDTGEMLPAEASGRIRPGDELVDINGNNVEGMNGDEATALIRKVEDSKVVSLRSTMLPIVPFLRFFSYRTGILFQLKFCIFCHISLSS